MTERTAPRVFISYALEDDAYTDWIEGLAAAMERDGIFVRYYNKDYEPTQPLTSFMNSEISKADRVLVVGSPQYRIKVQNTENQEAVHGVGWESSLLTSPKYQQKVIAAISRGTREESLPEHWALRQTFDLADPDDGREYERLVTYLRSLKIGGSSDEHSRAVRSKILPLWERQTQFKFACTLHDYIHSRWPDKGNCTIYPSWREFAGYFVSIPQVVEEKATHALDSSRMTLFVGATGTGKSVTAATIAYRWSRLSGRSAFWLDCNEFQSTFESDFQNDVAAILEAAGANLLVLDNAHNAPLFVRRLLIQFQNYDFSGHRLLIISRPLSTQAAATEASFATMPAGCTVGFDSTPDLLGCVADRMSKRSGLMRSAWDKHQFERWHQDFGGDVAAFAYALVQTKNGEPKASSVTPYIRAAYVDRFRKSGGLPTLTRLTSAAMIELTLNDAEIGEQGFAVAEALLGEGILGTTERVGYRCWKFENTGLAKLIATTLAMDTGVSLEHLYGNALADAVHDSPRLLGQVLERLSSRRDVQPVLEKFLDRLRHDQSTIISFLITQPIAALAAHRSFPDLFPWEQIFSNKLTQVAILSSLAKFPLQEITFFMRKIRKELHLVGNIWLDALLEVEGFYDSLETHAPNEVAAFLEFCKKTKPALMLGLAERLLVSERFKQVSSQAYPHHVGRFAIFIEACIEKKLPGSVRTYLSEVIRTETFFCKITQTQPDAVAIFLKLAEKYLRDDTRKILKRLAEDSQFFSSLTEAPPNLTKVFLEFTLASDPEGGRKLLRQLLGSPVFASLSASSRTEELGQFLAFADKHESSLTAELVRALLLRPEFTNRSEHLSSLLSPITIQIAFRTDQSLTLSLVDAMLSSEEFHHILCSSKPVNVKRALDALEKVGKDRVCAAVTLVVRSNVFETILSQSEPEQIAALLKLTSLYESDATKHLTVKLLNSEAFIIRSISSPPLHVASLARFATLASTEVAANFIAEWWRRFLAKNAKPDGKTMAECGPMLRVANEYASFVADEMVDWLYSQGDHFIAEVSDVKREIRQGLVKALAECGKTLPSAQMRALGA